MTKPHLCGCGEDNPTRFYDRMKGTCKVCHTATMRALQHTPKGWADNHLNRMRARCRSHNLISTLTSEEILSKVKSTGGHCEHCARQFEMPWVTQDHGNRVNKLETDHILTIPQALGRGVVWNDINNIQILCKTCHRRKTSYEDRARARELREEHEEQKHVAQQN